MSIKAAVDEPFRLTFATSPSAPGRVVRLTALYGTSGEDVGSDAAGDALSFPVTMSEGLDGVYSVEVMFGVDGVYWARFDVDGVQAAPTIIRVTPADFPAADARVDESYVVALVAPDSPASVQLTVTDYDGELAGVDDGGDAISWPEAMTQVPGYTDSWFYDSVVFTEGGRHQVAFAPASGPIRNAVISVHEDPSSSDYAHRQGWEPSEAMNPDAWVSIGYIRRWTGWGSSVTAEMIRELRRHAISTWIEETGMWVPAWEGTFHSLVGQGSRLYLPVPVLLPSDGGSEPSVVMTYTEGDQDEVQSVDLDDLSWRAGTRDAKQPYVEHSQWWDPELGVSVTATFGLVGYGETVPRPVQQAIVGLVKWHALSFGNDGADHRDQSTMNRVLSESTRDATIDYDQTAIGQGVTGDRQTDKTIAKYKIDFGPWASRCGPLGGSDEA